METNNLLTTVQNLYETHCENEQWATLIQRHFDGRFPDEESISKLPSLNDVPLHRIPSQSVVRFRCFVQDMFDPEFYLGAYEVSDRQTGHTRMLCGMYRDVTDDTNDVDLNSTKNVTMQRQLLYCISIPGENDWVKTCYSEKNVFIDTPSSSKGESNTQSRPKRPLEIESADHEIPMDVGMDSGEFSSSNQVTNKRMKDHTDVTSPESNARRNKTVADLNTPLPDANAVACIVKIYETGDSAVDFRLNEEYEFVGIITLDPLLAFSADEQGEAMPDEVDSSVEDELPPSLVPRLHVLKAFKLIHNNPLLRMRNPASDHALISSESTCAEIRCHLHSVLEQLLWGDGLAADYLICHLLSTIYIRRENTIGKLSLNLCRIPETEKSAFPVLFYDLLSSLVTKSHFQPLTIANLNELVLTPRKDYAANRVRSGRLQLPVHTHLVLDEMALEPGQLDAKGVRNVTALGNLLRWQRVDYDFSYHCMEFSSDVPVIVFSEGRSMLPIDRIVPVKPTGQPQGVASRFEAVRQYLSPGVVQQIREYLTLNRLRDCTMPDEVQQMIQEHFVAERQRNPSTTQDILHDWLVLARYLSLSYGQSSVSSATWERVKQLEEERISRLNERPT